MPPGEIERIGELLVEEGGVTQEDLARALAEGNLKGSPLASLLESCGHVRRAELAQFLASRFKVPVLDDLRRIAIYGDAARLVPEETARKHEAIPIIRLGDVLVVAKANYYNRAAVQELRKVSGLKIKVVQADEIQVRAAIEAIYKGKKGDLPAPASATRRKDTSVMKSGSTARIPVQTPAPASAAGDDMPLISMPENGASAPAMASARPGSEDLDELIDILDAIRIPPQEFANAQKDPLARLVVEFDDVFTHGRPATPLRVS